MFDKFQSTLEKFLNPIADVLNNNRFVTAITQGFMGSMPITLGVSLIAILINFPIEGWTQWLTNIGLYKIGQDFLSVTLSMLAIYINVSIAYYFSKNDGKNPMTGAMLSLGSFLAMMPLDAATIGKSEGISVLAISHMGAEGFFLAMLVALVVSYAYCKLTDMNVVLKLPDSVPPMVSSSMSPVFTAMIIFTCVLAVKYGFSLTSYGNAFQAFTTWIGKPIMALGASVLAVMCVCIIMNLFWFLGVHPNIIFSCYLPVIMSTMIANQEAYVTQQALPYFTYTIVFAVIQIGGAGNTLGLCIATLFAKSEKYKAMRKLVIPANLFNINEPVVFGFPLVMNPLYFIPMILTPISSVVIALLGGSILPIQINPYISGGTMPWVTPQLITIFLQGGIWLSVLFIVCLLAHFIIYLPFFLIDDKKTYEEEQANMLKGQAD